MFALLDPMYTMSPERKKLHAESRHQRKEEALKAAVPWNEKQAWQQIVVGK